MKIFFRVILFFFIILKSEAVEVNSSFTSTVAESRKFEIHSESLDLRPGQVHLIKLQIPIDLQVKEFLCHNKTQPFSIVNNTFNSFVVVSYFSKPMTFNCELQVLRDGKKEKIEIFKVQVTAYQYKLEHLKVAPKRVELSAKDLKRYKKEKVILDAIYQNFSKTLLFESPFMKPSNLSLSSEYGTKRVFNNIKNTQHLGVDFRAPQGTPVLASNKGKIVFSGDLFFSGNTILIDHGLSIFTMYGHLSKLKCKVGDLVDKGQVIGESGKTGRVSGPHLHWGVKVDGLWIDGFTLPLN